MSLFRNDTRPHPWLLGPALLSLLLLGIAHREILWPTLCVVGMLSAYLTDISLPWPAKGTRLRALSLVVLGWFVGYLYFLFVLDAGKGLHYFPRFLLRPWFYTPGVLLAAALLVYLWHTPFLPKERGWAIYALSGWIVICSGQFYRPQPIVVTIILFYCAAFLLALCLAPSGHQAWGTHWRPGRRQFVWLLCWGAAIGLCSWGVIRGLHRLEEDMARLIGELLRLPTYSGSLGADGSMRLRRRHQVRLSKALVAAVQSPRSPRYLRTRILSHYRHGIWNSRWRFSSWLPAKSLSSGHTQFSLSSQTGRRSQHKPPAVSAGKLHVRTYLSLSGAMLVPYGSTHMTVSAAARCRQSLEMTLDCRPVHLLFRYRFARAAPVSLGRGVFPAAVGAMTLPIHGALWQPTTRRTSRHAIPLAPHHKAPHHKAPHHATRHATRHKATARKVTRPASHPAMPRKVTPHSTPRKAAHPPPKQRWEGHPPALRLVLKALYPLATKVAGLHQHDPMMAAMAIQRYFRTNYTYSLHVKLALNVDPTVDFVLNRRPAYCQYFASGMALMMRALGHRARVANGFMVKEYNTYARRWIIRQRDAHAWTEVFDPQTQRWIAFDATAPAMLALSQPNDHTGRWAQLSAWLQMRWKGFLAASRDLRLGEWLRARSLDWLETFSRPQSWGMLIALIVLVWGFRQRGVLWPWLLEQWRALWGKGNGRQSAALSQLPQHIQARGLLLETLGLWGEYGMLLQAHETPEDFLLRLATLTQQHPDAPPPPMEILERLIAQYNSLRFQPHPSLDDAHMTTLKQLAKECLLVVHNKKL